MNLLFCNHVRLCLGQTRTSLQIWYLCRGEEFLEHISQFLEILHSPLDFNVRRSSCNCVHDKIGYKDIRIDNLMSRNPANSITWQFILIDLFAFYFSDKIFLRNV